MKHEIVYRRVMNGYEFVDLMKQLNWKRHFYGVGLVRHKGDFSRNAIVTDKVKKEKFEGWDFWFDRPSTPEVLSQETEIIYRTKTYSYWFSVIDHFLTENGFHRDLREG